MTIQQQIKENVKQAMRDKDELKLNTLRGLLAGFTNELVAQKRKPNEELEDKDAQNVLKRQIKQRKESIEQFKKGNRNDLAEKEEAELKILEKYLPEQMSKEDIEKIVDLKIKELGITDKSGVGKLMGAVIKEAKGNADSAIVKKIIDSKLN